MEPGSSGSSRVTVTGHNGGTPHVHLKFLRPNQAGTIHNHQERPHSVGRLMLQITKSKFSEVLFGVGQEDIFTLRQDLLALSEQFGSLSRDCTYDGIIKGPERSIEGIVTIRNAEPEGIKKSDDGLVIDLDPDSIDLLAGRLKLMQRGERFHEVCELTIFCKRKDATLLLVENR